MPTKKDLALANVLLTEISALNNDIEANHRRMGADDLAKKKAARKAAIKKVNKLLGYEAVLAESKLTIQ